MPDFSRKSADSADSAEIAASARPSRPVRGLIFEVREFALHDGPGVRTSVFFKGCPLRCRWCHNPESQAPTPQLLLNRSRCSGCGACEQICDAALSPDRRSSCVACGRCVDRCPQGARNLCGWETDVPTLVERLLRQRDLFELSGGGVTLTGGEPLFQPEFAVELARALRDGGIHVALETCGFASPEVFDALTSCVDLIYFDVKILDPERSRRWTGVDSAPILANLRRLCASGRPFVVRTPSIPGVNDSPAERAAVERLVDGVPSALGVEFLPYNVAAGAKYALLDRRFDPDLP